MLTLPNSLSARQDSMLATLPDALGDALGLVLAKAEREWDRQMEVVKLQHQVHLAEINARCDAKMAGLEETVAAQ